jgi:hypothetical protein
MPAMHIIKKTKALWDLSAQVSPMLCSIGELNKARQSKQSGANAICDCSGEKLPVERGNLAGIEITNSSYYFKGWE